MFHCCCKENGYKIPSTRQVLKNNSSCFKITSNITMTINKEIANVKQFFQKNEQNAIQHTVTLLYPTIPVFQPLI